MREIETDYLVVGAGATGLAFADALVAESDADVVLVDRRHRPGGHWLDAYPFVRLHQPSAYYGVNSSVLGHNRVDDQGPNAGFYERATAAEIVDYFNRALEELVASGRVRFFAMCDYRGADTDGHRFVSLLTGTETCVRVRRRVVDATYIESSIPSRHTPGFEIDDDVRLLAPNDLVDLSEPASGFTIIGAGKTAMDTCNWLLDTGVDANRIRWIRSRDGWFFNRTFMQPLDLVASYMQLQARFVERAADCDGPRSFTHGLEADGVMIRIDPTVEPEVFRGATVSQLELDSLRQIDNVVRLGRVRRIGTQGISFGTTDLPSDPHEVYVDCTAAGLQVVEPRPVFGHDRITMQYVTIGVAPWSAATIAAVEASDRDDERKNALCPPVVFTGEAADALRLAFAGMTGLVAARRRARHRNVDRELPPQSGARGRGSSRRSAGPSRVQLTDQQHRAGAPQPRTAYDLTPRAADLAWQPALHRAETLPVYRIPMPPIDESALLEFARSLAMTPRVSGNEEAAVGLAVARMQALGFDHTEIDAAGNAIGIIGNGSGPKLLIDGHIDSIPLHSEERWTVDPFGGEIIDGRLYGLGICDQTASIAAGAFGLASVADEIRAAGGTVALVGSVCEEEVEGAALAAFVERFQPDAAITSEPNDTRLGIGQRGRAKVWCNVTGRASHAGHAREGLNAAEALAAMIVEVRAVPHPVHDQLGRRDITCIDIASWPYPSVSTVPGSSMARFDCRFLPGETPDTLSDTLRSAAQRAWSDWPEQPKLEIGIVDAQFSTWTGATFDVPEFQAAWWTDESSALVTAAGAALADVGLDPTPTHYSFCTNGSYLAGVKHIPTIGFGVGEEHIAHQVDEYVTIESLFAGARGFAAIATRFTGAA